MAAVDYTRSYVGVDAVSVSWGGTEFSGETLDDSHFVTPGGHVGVTYFASSGDERDRLSCPSSHVVAAGGTSLNADSVGAYLGGSGWSGCGGCQSSYVSQPSDQRGLLIHNGSHVVSANAMRAGPDVCF